MGGRLPAFVRVNEHSRYRCLEALPGACVWLTLVGAVAAAWLAPLWALGFVLLFDVYWVIRVLYVMSYLVLAYRQYRQAATVDWLKKVQGIADWERVVHLIVVPTYHESEDVLRDTLGSLLAVRYPHQNLIVVLATEERDAVNIRPISERLRRQYAAAFRAMLVTEHPADINGEIAGKGANIAWAGRQAQRYIDQAGIPYRQVIVSTFDADSIAHPQYFSYLTYAFLTHPDRYHTSYQPIPLFHNNVWDALALMRVVATSTTFWLLGEAMRPDRLFTFSSHSMPLTALVDVGFWQTDVVSEDSRIFLQCLIRYDGHYAVTPMFIPISMDTIQAPSIWRSLVNQYKQIRRWAYGVENFPFMAWNFLSNPAMPRWTKARHLWNQFEGTYSWATAPLLIGLLGWLPFQFDHPSLAHSILAQNAPVVLQRLMLGAMVGLAVSAVISTAMLPRPTRAVRWYQWVMMVGQWIFLPITMIVFGSLPAIEAQTRLMVGKYLGFWVSEKRLQGAQSNTAPINPG
ncbi:MAG: glycosyltransferase [Patescibacteria group bacterium]